MAVKLEPPIKSDVKRVSIGARVYEPTDGAWDIDEIDADDLRRAGWQDVPLTDASSTNTVVTPTPEATDANP
jgi:hypothetical protein